MSNFDLMNGFEGPTVMDRSIQTARDFLNNFADDREFETKIAIAFGNDFDSAALETLRQQWKSGNFTGLPIQSAAAISGANGAFAKDTNTVYLSQDYLARNAGNYSAIATVILEEIGHFVDTRINQIDAPGDEGEIFAYLAQGQSIDEQKLLQLKTQNDAITIDIDGQIIPAEAATNPEDNLGLLTSSIKPLLDNIKSAINAQVLNNLPLLGNLDLKNYADQFITNNVEQKILDELNQETNKTVTSVQKALFEALGPTSQGGLGLLQDFDGDGQIQINDIKTPTDANSIAFNFKIGESFNPNISFAENLGLPNLGFNLKGGITPDLGFGLTVGFGVDNTTGADAFFVDTSTTGEFQAGLNAKLVNASNQPLELDGTLGFLKLKATDNGSNLKSNFSADLTSTLADANGRVKFSDLSSIGIAPNPKLTANADLKLKLNTGLDNGVLPSINSDFNLLGWQYDSTNPLTPAPTIEFKKVQLDLGSFVKNFAGTIVKDIQTVTQPFNPIISTLKEPLPVIGSSLLDLASALAEIGKGTVDPDTVKFIGQLADIVDLINKIPTNPDNVKIDLGDFNLGGTDVRSTPVSGVDPNPIPSLLPVAAAPPSFGNLAPFFDAIENSKNGLADQLKFPLIDDAKAAVKLLLGNSNVDLFTYQTPRLGFNFNLDLPPIPVFGPIVLKFGGSAGAGAQLKFGFDTKGLNDFKAGGFNNPEQIFDGFFASRPDVGNNLSLSGEINAAAGVSVGIADIAVGGGIGLTIGLDVTNPNPSVLPPEKFKVRGSTIASTSPLCLFEPSGALSAIIFASMTLDFGFFSFTKRFNLADINLIDFTANTGGCDGPLDSHFDVNDPEPDPKMQALLAGQGVIDRKGTGNGDVITVTHTQDGSARVDGKVVLTGLDPEPKTYENVKLIVINGGNGNDQIKFVDIVASGQLNGGTGDDVLIGGKGYDFLGGGAGNDNLDGAGGTNTAVYGDAPAGVLVNLATGIANDGYGTVDTLTRIQNVEGSRFNDVLIANLSGSVLDAGAGDDQLIGNNGNDVMLGGAGADAMDGKAGTDTTTYISSQAPVYVNLSNQDIALISPVDGVFVGLLANRGFGGDAEGDEIFNVENVQGSVYDDVLVAGDTSVNVDGFLGNDLIVAAPNAQILDGGQGFDWISYSLSTAAVNVSLATGNGFGGYAQGDQLKFVKDKDGNNTPDNSFENLEGSDFSDILTGDRQNNIIRGLAGNDNISGLEGDDVLIGGLGADVLSGGANSSPLRADLTVWNVRSRLPGGGDTASYQDSSDFVVVNLLAGIGFNADAEGDTFSGIENLIGSNFADNLIGDFGNNDINPGLSNGGTDIINGFFGRDRLTLDYSFNDFGTGITGGFQNTVAGSGFISRNTSDDSSIQDAVSFTNIERLFVTGTIQNDQIIGGADSDVLLPGAGNDFVNGGGGIDLLDGNDGIDTLSDNLSDKTENIVLISTDITKENPNQVLSLADGTLITKFEVFKDIKTGSGNDQLTQLDRVNNNFSTDGGTDTVNPGLGFDTVDGGVGGQVIYIPGIGFITLPDNDLLILDYSVQDTGSEMVMSVSPQQKSGFAFRSIDPNNIEAPLLDAVNFQNFERYQVTGTIKDDFVEVGDGNDTANGGAGNDNLLGNRGNDLLAGGEGNDILTATNNTNYGGSGFGNDNPPNFPKDIDTLTGGAGADLFVLGDSLNGYYENANYNDYALITDFNPAEGDVIQLQNLQNCGFQYFIGESSGNLPSGTAIYVSSSDPEFPELIAIVQGATNLSFAGNPSYFSFVGEPCPIIK